MKSTKGRFTERSGVNIIAGGRVIGRRQGSTKSFYLTDHLGSTRAVFTSAGVVQEVYDYYPFGLVMPGRTFVSGTGTKEKFTGKERDEETGLDYFGARYYMPAVGRWGSVDPLADEYPGWSPYNYALNNPLLIVDPDGAFALHPDDYYVNPDGTIEVDRTDDNFDRFYLTNSEGSSALVGQLDKNDSGLMQLPSKLEFDDANFGTSFGLSVKEGNEYRSFISGEAFAALIGALAVTRTQDLTVVGFSLRDGSSPEPSKSHIGGRNGDLRYLRTDRSGGPLYLNKTPELLDAPRQDAFNDALYTFGWKDLLAHTYTLHGQRITPNRSRHFRKHHHHLHLQGFRPTLIVR